MNKLWLILPLFVFSLRAELPQVRLWSIFPLGAKVGSTAEISITGADLDDSTELQFSSPGIKSSPKLIAGTTNQEPNRFIVTIDPGAQPGSGDVRVRGRFGVSNPRTFTVSTLTELVETEPNNSGAEAMKLELPCVINGTADPENYDHFRFTAKADEKIILRCAASSIDSRLLPSLIILNSKGAELARSRQGGFLEFNPPSDEDFIVRLHDAVYKGGGEHGYRLEIGKLSHIDRIEPGSGVAGQKSRHRLFGRNLSNGISSQSLGIDGKPLETSEIDIDFPVVTSLPTRFATDASSLNGFDYLFKAEQGISNPFFLVCAEGNHLSSTGELSSITITIPSHFSCIFRPVKETPWLRFSSEKSEVFWIEVISDRLGFPTDPHILVQRITKNDKGEEQYHDAKELYDLDQNIGGREYNTATRDAALRFDAPEKGDYRAQARDLFHLSKRSGYPYLLAVRKERPDFSLALAPFAPPNPNKDLKTAPVWANFLRKGDRQPIKVLVTRTDNFNGEIQLSAEGLPKGVRIVPSTIPAGVSTMTLMLEAAEDAEGFAGKLKIFGSAKMSEQAITREATGFSQVWNVDDYAREPIISRVAEPAFALSSFELAPVALISEEKTWETSLGGKLSIPLTILRRGEFNNGLKFRLLTEPPKEWDVDGKATNANVDLDVTAAKLPVGMHNLFLLAQTAGKYRRLNSAEIKQIEEEVKSLAGAKDSEARVKELNARIAPADFNSTFWAGPIRVNVISSPVKLEFASGSVDLKPSGKSELPVKITRLFGFKEPVDLTVAFPADIKGLAAAKLTIPADQTEGKLIFEAATDTLAGEKKANIITVARWNGQELKTESPVSILLSAPEKK